MLGSLLKGGAWCATLTLATVGALTFVPDESWERFPSALAHTRAQLAEFGIAPSKYRTGAPGGEITLVDENAPTSDSGFDSTNNGSFDDASSYESRSRVHVGNGNASFTRGASSNFDVGSLASRQTEPQAILSETSTSAPSAPVENGEIRAPLFEGESNASAPVFDPTREIPAPAPVEDPSSFSPEFFAGNNTNSANSNVAAETTVPVVPSTPDELAPPVVAANDLNALEPTPISTKTDELQTPPVVSPLEPTAPPVVSPLATPTPLAEQQAPDVEPQRSNPLPQNENANPTPGVTTLSSDASVLQAPQTPPSLTQTPNPLETTPQSDSQSFISNSSATSDVLSVASELERALNEVKSLNTNEQARDVFMTLNRIQRTQSDVLAEADQARLNDALDQLAYEAFYNPTRFLLEAPRKTAPGETLSSIAREYDVTPRLLASINGLDVGVDDPLPSGASLKTVRGPVTAEVSVGKKELLLRFNDIYAGRFKLGVPHQATTLRGTHLVESKLTNPACDAVDASGATISIPGGSPDNPLGSCWIGLSGGYGLQGTNRPELVGTVVPENGGFVFSNLEISQLDVLLPIGAAISFVD